MLTSSISVCIINKPNPPSLGLLKSGVSIESTSYPFPLSIISICIPLFNKLKFVAVNRENPGPSALKGPVRILKEGKKSFVLFPTGSRYSDDIKSGAVIIARLSRKNIVPVVYDGPLTFKDLFKRQKMIIRYGSPIKIDSKKDKELEEKYNRDIRDAFDRLQVEIDASK